MKRTIVTGATGFVGANLARRLLREGHELHLLVRPDHNPWRIEALGAAAQVHEVAFDDATRLAHVMASVRPEWVFHLATHGAYSWQNDARAIVHTNMLGTIGLVEACLAAGAEAIVNTGSSSEYGFKDHAPTEGERIDPNSVYAVTKAAATLYCQHIARTHGVRLLTLRLYSAYGPYEDPQRLIPRLIVRGLAGALPPLVDPTVARDLVYVEDVCDAFLLAAACHVQEAGAVYNVGTGVQTTIGEAVALARCELSIAAEPVWNTLPGRSWDARTWVADNRKIRQELGWQPRHSFAQGFRLTRDWLCAHPALLARYQSAG